MAGKCIRQSRFFNPDGVSTFLPPSHGIERNVNYLGTEMERRRASLFASQLAESLGELVRDDIRCQVRINEPHTSQKAMKNCSASEWPVVCSPTVMNGRAATFAGVVSDEMAYPKTITYTGDASVLLNCVPEAATGNVNGSRSSSDFGEQMPKQVRAIGRYDFGEGVIGGFSRQQEVFSTGLPLSTNTGYSVGPYDTSSLVSQHEEGSKSAGSCIRETKSCSFLGTKEMLYRAAALQPVNLSEELMRRPRRKNVRISSDPQSVAARHRRQRISDRIRILQRLVPGGIKMDTASMLEEAVQYLKFLKMEVETMEAIGKTLHIPASSASAGGLNITKQSEGMSSCSNFPSMVDHRAAFQPTSSSLLPAALHRPPAAPATHDPPLPPLENFTLFSN